MSHNWKEEEKNFKVCLKINLIKISEKKCENIFVISGELLWFYDWNCINNSKIDKETKENWNHGLKERKKLEVNLCEYWNFLLVAKEP